MGTRIHQVYTKQGDNGQTSLSSPDKQSKADPVFSLLGDLDELNCAIGIALSNRTPDIDQTDDFSLLEWSQHKLFDLGGEISFPSFKTIASDDIKTLELNIDTLVKELGKQEEFILPGGHPLSAQIMMARAICRRTERGFWLYHSENSHCRAVLGQFLNRLSDYLFIFSRSINQRLNHSEIFWQKGKQP